MIPESEPIQYPPIAIPSHNMSNFSVSNTRSLKVPGSPSSALQTTYFLFPFAALVNSHFIPVGNPAPPRPLSFDDLIMEITSSGFRVIAFFNPASATRSTQITEPFFTILFLTIDLTSSSELLPSPNSLVSDSGDAPLSKAFEIDFALSTDKLVIATSLTKIAGA